MTDQEKQQYQCTKCKFTFSKRKDSEQELKCPYCGEKQLIAVTRFKDVNDLIEEAASEKYDY